MKMILKKITIIIYLLFIFLPYSYADIDEIDKINKQLKSIESLYDVQAIDKEEYEKIKSRLLTKKKELEKPKKSEKDKNTQTSIVLEKQIEILKKLRNDGVISEEEFQKSKIFLVNKESKGENVKLENFENKSVTPLEYEFVYPKNPGRKIWEKTELKYKNYKILPYRAGGIKIVRVSDNKVLLRITDNFKAKFYNGGEKHIIIEKNIYESKFDYSQDGITKHVENTVNELKQILKNPFSKRKKPVWDKEAHRLKLFIDGKKLLTFEGRYVKKHQAFFYQVLTPRHEPFHYYIKIKAKTAIALNMEIFNVKIDKAIRKAKTRLSKQFDVTEEEIQKIIDNKINEELDNTVDQEIENAINDSVAEAIEESIGQATSQSIIDAIEKATGEAIDQAMENELADHIDKEIQKAIQDGIEEAAVAAGFQAYYDTLLAGGSIEDALRNAGEACGAGCEFVLDE